MAPEWTPDMEELNKRRVERHHRRQQRNAQRRRRRTTAMVLACLFLIVAGISVFFLLRRGENAQPQVQTMSQSPEAVPEDATVIHLVAAGDVNVTDSVVVSGGLEYDYTNTLLDVAHLLAEGDITVCLLYTSPSPRD